MSQQSGGYGFLVERIHDLLAEEYGFREHWEVSIANNIGRGTVSFTLLLRQTPGRHRYGDMQVGFEMAGFLFTEFTIVRERVLESANSLVSALRYRDQQANHPPQVKIYCWLRENNQEMRDQYIVPEPRIQEPPFSSSVHLHVLLADLLGFAFGTSVTVHPREVRIGGGGIGEMIFSSPRELSNTVAQLLSERRIRAIPDVASQPQRHVRRVEL